MTFAELVASIDISQVLDTFWSKLVFLGTALWVAFKARNTWMPFLDRVLLTWARRQNPELADDIYPTELAARFCDSADEVKRVLQLREAYFVEVLKTEKVSSDDSYWKAFDANRFAFSIVSQNGRPFGYWGLIPVAKDWFEKFKTGAVSHEDMLSKAIISWEAADPNDLYLYHIGAVVLPDEGEAVGTMKFNLRAGRLELDNVAQLYRLSRVAKISGIAVYPSTDRGSYAIRNQLIDLGFENTKVRVDNKPLQEIYTVEGDDIRSGFEAVYKVKIQPLLKRKPRWYSPKRWLDALVSLRLGPEFKKGVPDRDLNELQKVWRLLRKT